MTIKSTNSTSLVVVRVVVVVFVLLPTVGVWQRARRPNWRRVRTGRRSPVVVGGSDGRNHAIVLYVVLGYP